MNFVGLKKETDRAAVIELLRQAADAPIAQPEPAVAEVTVPADEIVVEIPAEDPTETVTEQ